MSVFRPFYFPSAAVPLTKPRFIIQNDTLVLYKNPIHSISQYHDLLEHPQVMLPTLGSNDYYYQHGYKREIFDIFPSVRLFKMMNYKLRYRLTSRSGYYKEDSEAFQVTLKLFDMFHSSVVRQNSLPIILLFPERFDFPSYRKKKRYTPLLRHFDTKGYDYVDLFNAFDGLNEKFKLDELFMKGNHYSPLGNELVAKHICRKIAYKNPLLLGKPSFEFYTK